MNITYNGKLVRRTTSVAIGEVVYARTVAYTPETNALHYTSIAHPSPARFRDAGDPYLRIKRTGQDDWDIKRFDPPYPTQAQVLKQAEKLDGKIARIKHVKEELLLRPKPAKDLIEEYFEDGGRGPRKQSAGPCELMLDLKCAGKAARKIEWETDDLDYAMEHGGLCYYTIANACASCTNTMLAELSEHSRLWRARFAPLPAPSHNDFPLWHNVGSDDSLHWWPHMPLSPSWIEYWKSLRPRMLFHDPGGEHHGLGFKIELRMLHASASAGFKQQDMPRFLIRFPPLTSEVVWAEPHNIFKEHEPARATKIELPDIPAGEGIAGITAENALKSIVADWRAAELDGFDAACIETLAEDVGEVIERLIKWKMDVLAPLAAPQSRPNTGLKEQPCHR